MVEETPDHGNLAGQKAEGGNLVWQTPEQGNLVGKHLNMVT
jgi:hypothetical protein